MRFTDKCNKQGGRSPGKVREFQSGQGKVGENEKSQGKLKSLTSFSPATTDKVVLLVKSDVCKFTDLHTTNLQFHFSVMFEYLLCNSALVTATVH